jgi:hypothetical protein
MVGTLAARGVAASSAARGEAVVTSAAIGAAVGSAALMLVVVGSAAIGVVVGSAATVAVVGSAVTGLVSSEGGGWRVLISVMMMMLGLVLPGEGEGAAGCLRGFHREGGGDVILVMMLGFGLLGDSVAVVGGHQVCRTGEGGTATWMKKKLGLDLPGEGEAGEMIWMTMRMTVVKNLVFGLPGEGEVVVEGSLVCHAEEAGGVI